MTNCYDYSICKVQDNRDSVGSIVVLSIYVLQSFYKNKYLPYKYSSAK